MLNRRYERAKKNLKNYSEIRCIALRVYANIEGVNVNHNVTCSLILECSRIAKEMAMVSGFFSKEGGRRCFILASDKNKKDQENLRSKFNKNALTAIVSLASLEIRSINEEAINSIRNRIYSLKIFYFLLYRRQYFLLVSEMI